MTDVEFPQATTARRRWLRMAGVLRDRRMVAPSRPAYALVATVALLAGLALDRRPRRRYRHQHGPGRPRWAVALPAGAVAGVWTASLATLLVPGRPTSLRDDLVSALWPTDEPGAHQRPRAMAPYGVVGWVGDVSVSGMGSSHDGVSTLQLSFSRRSGSFADAIAGTGAGASVDVESVALDGPPADEAAERPPLWEVRQAAAQLAGMVGGNDGPLDAIWADRSTKARAYARLPWDTIDVPCDGAPVTFWLLRPPPQEDIGGRPVWVAYGVLGGVGLRLAGWGVSPGDLALERITDLDPILERDRERRAAFLD